ncbi:MAG: hypothetical protein H0V12_02555 [Chloroflexi bacterium]|jgi:hypothetical protein|nr:hypothetical protein [Chloroflexota bacterium]
MPEIPPALVLALIVGVFHTALYVLIRGSTRGGLPFLLLAAVLGAYAGQALGMRLPDPVRLGDFSFIWSSVLAWAGLLIVAIARVLGPSQEGL